jgi:microcompartment protein CcmL/EutN
MDPRPTGRSLGLVETHGFVAAVEAADAMTKAARVAIARYEVTRGALVTILVRGELAEVEAAVAAGSAAAAAIGELMRGHVIPSPSPEIESVLLQRRDAARSESPVRRPAAS